MDNKAQGEVFWSLFLAVFALGLIVLFLLVAPIYNVWASEQYGRAELAKAEFSKQVAVQEAKAKFESSTLLANAEIERAKGVAQANKIIGDSLKGNEDYLRYLYINGITENPSNREIIYIPTEAGIPILEAGKR